MKTYVRILGTLEVLQDDVPVGPGPELAKPQALLASLAIHANEVIAKAQLVERIWEQPPSSARNLVEKYVSLWRRTLTADRLQTVAGGYRLSLRTDEFDLTIYRRRLAEGRELAAADDHAGASVVLAEACRMWHGWDVRGFAERLLPSPEAQVLVDLHLRGLEEMSYSTLAAGGDLDVQPLRVALELNPYRERLAEMLIWALARQGDHAAAVDVYQRTRQILADDLGQTPGDALRRMHARVVRRAQDLVQVRSQARAPVISNLPPRWQRFIGRSDGLDRLRALLLADRHGGEGRDGRNDTGVAVCGGVGVGKSALVLEFLACHVDEFDLIWFINAPTRTAILDGLTALAQRLGCPIPQDGELDLTPLWNALRQRRRWVFVLDNAEQPAELADYWPPQSNGTLIVTTRNPDWGRHVHTLDLEVLTGPETVALLRERGVRGSDTSLYELALELDGLPLACEQAAAFVRQTGMDATGYLELFRRRRSDLLSRGMPDDHHSTIEATWKLALAQLSGSPAAVELALLCAALAPEDIPLDLITAAPSTLPGALAATVWDRLALEDAIGELRHFSLLTRSGDSVRMHRLVQAVIAGSRPSAEAGLWRLRALDLLLAAAPADANDRGSWPRWQSLVPHVNAVAGGLDGRVAASPPFTGLLRRTGDYLAARGSFDDARALLERAITIIGPGAQRSADLETELGRTWTELGDVLLRSGNPAEAISAHERALAVLGRRHPGDHPLVARSVAGLNEAITCHHGVSMWQAGDLPEAEHRFLAAIEVLTAALGPDHPVVASALSGLGQVRQDRGDVDGGAQCQQTALRILLAVYGPDHADVGHVQGKLGFALALRGDFGRARPAQEESLRILTLVFGAGHPETGWPLSNLGVLCLDAGDPDAAMDFQQQAHRVFCAAPGQQVAGLITQWRMARILLRTGRATEASTRLDRIVPALRQALGERHADVFAAAEDAAAAHKAADAAELAELAEPVDTAEVARPQVWTASRASTTTS